MINVTRDVYIVRRVVTEHGIEGPFVQQEK